MPVPGQGAGGAIALRAPQTTAPWQPTAATDAGWQLDFKGADARLQQDHEHGAQRLRLRVAYYRWQRQGAEIINHLNHVAGPDRGRVLGTGQVVLQISGSRVQARYERRAVGADSSAIVYWYWIGETFTANAWSAKWLEFKARLFGGNRAAAVVAIEVPLAGSASQAADIVRAFLAHSEPLGALLMQASASREAS